MIGYARVSTTDQNLEVQEAALRAAGCDLIRSEKRSGTTTAGRDEPRTILDFLRTGDVHLIGIEPARGSQAPTLMQEADTTAEWGQDIVRRFLSERTKVATEGTKSTPNPRVVRPPETDDNEALSEVARVSVEALTPSEIKGLEAYWKSSRGLPTDERRRCHATASHLPSRK